MIKSISKLDVETHRLIANETKAIEQSLENIRLKCEGKVNKTSKIGKNLKQLMPQYNENWKGLISSLDEDYKNNFSHDSNNNVTPLYYDLI